VRRVWLSWRARVRRWPAEGHGCRRGDTGKGKAQSGCRQRAPDGKCGLLGEVKWSERPSGQRSCVGCGRASGAREAARPVRGFPKSSNCLFVPKSEGGEKEIEGMLVIDAAQ